ncbi:16S rRNA (guanine(966)-N(2))-methyltransferase RsmD [Waddlia chondrophila]|uniref:Methyltransferase n=2 Tax=Waddlia chondrophila TaxID=71667 RepID=D6YTP7_WADCW|nr:16S rRNA (guanine(966)-N(2))-methyltransferase RsmD [Waddlia chondrophila]ADI37508.1 methyltransferase [Waddlia chondrophila WSU 86-1044]
MLQIIGGKLKRKKLKSPKGLNTRPTSSRLRETVFDICQQEIERARFLDLFSGSGSMGIEALSRGAGSAVFVDHDRGSIRCIQENIQELGLADCARAVIGDVIKLLPKLGTFDVIYVDPPYFEKNRDFSHSAEVLKAIDQSDLLAHGGMLFIEDSRSWEPDSGSLKTLRLKSSRKVGRSMLHQFER